MINHTNVKIINNTTYPEYEDKRNSQSFCFELDSNARSEELDSIVNIQELI
jgi:hypothetical protein